MLDMVMVYFFKVMCKHSKGKTDTALLRLFMRCSLWRDHLDGTMSVWGEKVFSSCLLILRLCCTREWNSQCTISTEAESAFFPPALSPQDVIS